MHMHYAPNSPNSITIKNGAPYEYRSRYSCSTGMCDSQFTKGTLKLEPPIRFERITCSLQMSCSANWAKEAFEIWSSCSDSNRVCMRHKHRLYHISYSGDFENWWAGVVSIHASEEIWFTVKLLEPLALPTLLKLVLPRGVEPRSNGWKPFVLTDRRWQHWKIESVPS